MYLFIYLVSQCCVKNNRKRGRRCWGSGREEVSWWRSVECSGRSYLSCSVYQLPLFQLLMTWCQSLSLKTPMKKRSNKGLFLPSVLISSSSSQFFLSVFRRGEMRQSGVSAQSCNSRIKDHVFVHWCCIFLKMRCWGPLVCFSGWGVKIPCGTLMSSILPLNIPQALYDLCVQQSRRSLVMGLTRLAENMMGVPICRQVVFLNDGRASSPVECSLEWVGCGMTVWAHPTFDAPSVCEPGLTEIFELFYPLFVQGGGPEFAGISNQHKLLYLSVSPFFALFDMWVDNDTMKWTKYRGVSASVMASTCNFSVCEYNDQTGRLRHSFENK